MLDADRNDIRLSNGHGRGVLRIGHSFTSNKRIFALPHAHGVSNNFRVCHRRTNRKYTRLSTCLEKHNARARTVGPFRSVAEEIEESFDISFDEK